MKVRWSASFIKKYESCKFFAYCKLQSKEKDDTVDMSYGDSGNVVHETLEYYYRNLLTVPFELALVELKNFFNTKWEQSEILNPKIDKDVYWLCVINGLKLDIKPTHLEYEFSVNTPIDFLGYADVMNNKEHWIGDWKTSSYKSSKVELYQEQLRYYTWAYYRQFNTVPKAWVFFNKVNKKFPFKFTLDDIKATERHLLELDSDLDTRFKRMDFPRTPSRNNCYFCPYKNLCATDLLRTKTAEHYEITFHLKKNKLLIEGSIPDVIHRKIEKETNYMVKNAHFRIAAMKSKGVHYDGIKRLYHRREYGGETTQGYMHTIRNILKEFAHSEGKLLKLTIKDFRDQDVMNSTIPMPEKLNIPFELYGFQKTAVEELIRFRWGIVEIGTGGGKTAIAAECIRRLATPTLFVIDNKDLLLQTKKEYEEMLGIPCGIVGMGYREWDKTVVLSTIQTLAKDLKRYEPQLARFNLVIFDETHIIAAKSFEKLSKVLINTKYRFGFSATAKRDDGDDNIIYANTGTIVYRKPARELIEEKVLVKPVAIFHQLNQRMQISESFADAYRSGIVENEFRNKMIRDLAIKYVQEGKQVMILSKIIDHGKYLQSLIPNSRFVYGKTDDDIRVSDLDDFRKREFNVLIGNIMIFNKGINIKNLDVIINATGNAGDVLTVQTIGRALRLSEGKDIAFYVDFIDSGEYLYKHSMSRVDALRQEGYEVQITS